MSDSPSIASAVAFSPNGRTLAAVCAESVVRLIDPTTGKNRVAATAHLGSVLLVTATRDGHISFSAGADGIIYCWDARNGRERYRLLGHPHSVFGHTGSAGNVVWMDPRTQGFCVIFTNYLRARAPWRLVHLSNAVAAAFV